MSNYVIYTDSACDIAPAILKEWGCKFCSLSFMFDDSNKTYLNFDMPIKEFYQKMRDGGVAKTAAINADTFIQCFEPELQAGNDVLYLGFSSGLSSTFNSARIAAVELSEKYPERKIIAVDSLAASAGFGLLLYLVVQKKKEGATIEEAVEYAKQTRLHICHWFTVDDLVYLKRGGRISAATALVGGILGIKPVLHVDNAGHLVSVSKARGRKASIKAIVDQYGKLALDPKNGTVFICNGDCMEDVETMKKMLKEQYGAKVQLVTDTGAVIGAHSGPGTLALFFVGKER